MLPQTQPVQTTARTEIGLREEASRGTWLSVMVICLMMVTMAALFWFPLRRTFANVEVNYNEGWNAYRADMVARRIPIYGERPQGFGTSTAYPPLSFHVIAMLGAHNTFPLVGRCVSILSLLAMGILVALIVKQSGGSGQAAVFSFLLYEIGIALLRPDRIGMDDPQLLGEALCAAGLYFYVRNPDSRRLLFASAALFCLAGFTKHNLIAFPAVVAVDLLFRSWKGFLTWAGAMLLFVGLLTAGTLLIDGRYFLVHLLASGGGGRTYSYMTAWNQFHKYAEKFQALLVIATAWSILLLRSRRFFSIAFVITNGLAFLLSGGYGLDLNIFFNALAITVMVCGIALSDVTSTLPAWRPALWNSAAAVMAGIFAFGVALYVPGELRRDRQQLRTLPADEAEFQSAVEFLKSHPGPAICESHLLCYEAGKPFEFEPFSVRDQVMTGHIPEGDVLSLLKTHHFQTVEVALRYDEEDLNAADLRTSLTGDQKEIEKERRFSPNFMNELLNDYQLSLRTRQMIIFSPK